MKEFSLRLVDVAAAGCWLASIGLGMDDAAGGPGDVRGWAIILSVLAATFSVVGWLSRRLDHLEQHVYTEGYRAGFGDQQIVKLPEQRSR